MATKDAERYGDKFRSKLNVLKYDVVVMPMFEE